MPTDRPLLVLLAEDDPDIALLTQEVLEDAGFRVVHAPDGQRALDALDVVTPDVIVSDIMMPVLDGFGFMERYFERPGPHAPIIVVSAFGDYRASALTLGAAAALPKPFELDTFLSLVRGFAARGAQTRPASEAPAPAAPLGPLPAIGEEARLKAILEMQLDHPSPGFDAFTERVAAVFGVPICLVSIITADRQYWTASCGLPADLAEARGTDRRESFCTHAVVSRSALIVQDALENPFFRHNLLVRTRGFRFYAGVPISGHLTDPVGTVCLLDVEPRVFTWFDLELLSLMGRRVMAELERRERAARPQEPPSAFERLDEVDADLGVLGRELFADVVRAQACRHFEKHEPLAVGVLVAEPEALAEVVRRVEARLARAHLGRLGLGRVGVVCPGPTHALEAALREELGPSAMVVVADAGGGPTLAIARLRQIEAGLGGAGLSVPREKPATTG